MISVIAHELAEATSDPLLSAWFNVTTGEEIADTWWTSAPQPPIIAAANPSRVR
jgi:hypothetical protein